MNYSMEVAMNWINNAANFSRKSECNTVTGKGPFDVMMSKTVEIEFQSRRPPGQLNMALGIRLSV